MLSSVSRARGRESTRAERSHTRASFGRAAPPRQTRFKAAPPLLRAYTPTELASSRALERRRSSARGRAHRARFCSLSLWARARAAVAMPATAGRVPMPKGNRCVLAPAPPSSRSCSADATAELLFCSPTPGSTRPRRCARPASGRTPSGAHPPFSHGTPRPRAQPLGVRFAARLLAAPRSPAPHARRYDPYAPTNAEPAAAAPSENVYEKSKAALAMARLTGGVEVDTDRGLWKGHGRLKGFNAPAGCAPLLLLSLARQLTTQLARAAPTTRQPLALALPVQLQPLRRRQSALLLLRACSRSRLRLPWPQGRGRVRVGPERQRV